MCGEYERSVEARVVGEAIGTYLFNVHSDIPDLLLLFARLLFLPL